jgi:hypothetical protein
MSSLELRRLASTVHYIILYTFCFPLASLACRSSSSSSSSSRSSAPELAQIILRGQPTLVPEGFIKLIKC